MIEKVRQINIRNRRGDIWELNDTETFGHSPQGLGAQFDIEYEQSGTAFLTKNKQVNQQQISLEMVFGLGDVEAYESYELFGLFLNFPPLVLEYTTNGRTFFRDVEFSSLNKEDGTQYGNIQSTLVLNCISMWYIDLTYEDDFYRFSKGGGKVLDKKARPYTYERVDLQTKDNEIIFYNPSQYHDPNIKSAFEIEVLEMEPDYKNKGVYMNLWVNGVIVQQEGIMANPTEDTSILVSSFPHEQRVVSKTGDKETSIYTQLDVTRSNFIEIPQGDSRLELVGFKKSMCKFRVRYEWVVV